MSKLYNSLVVAMFSTFAANVSIAQECNQQIKTTASDQRFVDNMDGTITDIQNSLMWTKCSLGQTVSASGDCVGTPTHYANWSEALLAAKTKVDEEATDYRVPNIKELASLVEYACIEPAISVDFFNGTPNAIYYSSTPDSVVNVDSNQVAGMYGRVIDFTDGTEFVRDVNRNRYVRLVRDISGQ